MPVSLFLGLCTLRWGNVGRSYLSPIIFCGKQTGNTTSKCGFTPFLMLMDTLLLNSQKAPDTIVIVDDNELNRDVLNNIFAADFFIKTAENGQEALEKIREHESDICAILLDVCMPVMDGMAVLEELARQDLPSRIPVFLITAETDTKLIKHAYELGAMDVISKPFSSYIVQRRISSVIELFTMRKQLAGVVDRQQDEILLQAQQIIKLNMGLIESLSTAIEFRSGESGAHVRRIHDITKLFLEFSPLKNNFSEEVISHVALAAIMHDVGKLSVPDSILNKPGRLTAEEFEIMKTHTTQGCRLLDQIPQMRELPFFGYARNIARHHHERWDGRGYPDGLKGDDIPLCAQIVSIADVYDALVSPRVYKKAFSFETALSMIVHGECGIFNPLLLEYFQAIEGRIRKLYVETSQKTQD